MADPRPLDPGEVFFFLADRLSCMNFVLYAERPQAWDGGRLRLALDRLVAENPLLRVGIQWDSGQGPRFVPATAPRIALETRQGDAGDWLRCVEDELSRPFDEGDAPLLRCLQVLCPQGGNSVLMLCFHHSIADGRSGAALLRRLLALAANPEAEAAHPATAAVAPMHALFPPGRGLPEDPDAARQAKAAMLARYQRHGAISPVPWFDDAATSRQPRAARIILEPDTALALQRGCREQGTSLHGLLGAAQLICLSRLLKRDEAACLLLACPVDLRPHLQPPPATTPIGLYIATLSAAYVVAADSDPWELARAIMQDTRQQLAEGEAHAFFDLYGLRRHAVPPEGLARFHRALQASLQNSMLSNIGRIAAVDDDPAVTAIGFALCPMPYQLAFAAVSSYHDRLLITVTQDIARIPEAKAAAYVAGLRTVLEDVALECPPAPTTFATP